MRVRAKQRYEDNKKKEAKVKNLEEGLEKLRKTDQLKNMETVEDAVTEIGKKFNESKGTDGQARDPRRL